MNLEDLAAPSPGVSSGEITVHNRLDRGHRYLAAIDEVIRTGLRGQPGPWEVWVCPVGRAWFRVDVVGPDGARWSLSVPVHGGPRPEELADSVRAASVRPGRARPAERTSATALPDKHTGRANDVRPNTASHAPVVPTVRHPVASEGAPQ